MRIVPFFVVLACLAWAGFSRDWFDLAWAATGVLLLGIDGALSLWRASSDRGAKNG